MKPTTPLEVRINLAPRFEIRSNDSANTVYFGGYATAYDFSYDVCGGPSAGGWSESVAPGAGKRTLDRLAAYWSGRPVLPADDARLDGRNDPRFLVNHDGVPMARYGSGTLQLEEDSLGLMAVAPSLDLRNPTVQELRSAMDRRDLDSMSFAFRTIRQEWNADFTQRRIVEYALDIPGSDVSAVTYPANGAAMAELNNLQRAAARVDELRSTGGQPSMSLEFLHAIRTQIHAHN